MSKILVTGAAGFIGFHLALRLLERGDAVVGLDMRIPTNSSTHSGGNRPLIPRQFVHFSERSDAGGFFLLEVDELVNVCRQFAH